MPTGKITGYSKVTLTGRILDGNKPPRHFANSAGDIKNGEADKLQNNAMADYEAYSGRNGQPRARNVRRASAAVAAATTSTDTSLKGTATISSYRSGLGGMLEIDGNGTKIRFSDRVVSPASAKLTKGDRVEYTLYSKERRGVWARRVKPA